jgi:hypothetical protein
MIELYTFMSLLGIGYLLSKTSSRTPTDTHTKVNVRENPSMYNIYDSDYVAKVQQLEQQQAKKTYSTHVSSTHREDKDFLERNKKIKSNLAGIEIPSDQFIHNNMVPFFGSRIKQNVSSSANRPTLEKFTGQFNEDICFRKSEMKPLFDPNERKQDIYGNKYESDYLRDRINEPRIRNNERPFESIIVGPGLDQGYSSKPTGGFQQYEVRDYAMPKNVDELRVGGNPKLSYSGRILPAKGSTQRGQIGEMNKNRDVVTFFENKGERNFTTVGAYTKEKQRPEVEVKETARTCTTREYTGDAYRNTARTTEPVVKETSRQQLKDYGFRNVDGEEYGKGVEYDYGKYSIRPVENERDTTTEKTYEGNLTSLVKSIIAPLEDIFRNTRKEYMIQNPRAYGQLQPTFPERITIKDPNDVARTTIKETLIHDTIETGNIRGPTKLTVYDPEDIARRTIRETVDPMSSSLNLFGGKYTGTIYPEDKPLPTIKDTTIDKTRDGNIESLERLHGAYKSTKYDAKDTQKQYISDNDYYGAVNKANEDGYKIAPAEAPDTQKQFLSDNDYIGGAVAGENKKPVSIEDIMNARINELKESTLEGREPTKESVKVASGADDITVSFKKLELDECTSRQFNNIEHVVNTPYVGDDCAITKYKDQLDNDDRLDINILSSLQDNPYAMKNLASA